MAEDVARLKTSCQSCGRRLAFRATSVGSLSRCPACGGIVELKESSPVARAINQLDQNEPVELGGGGQVDPVDATSLVPAPAAGESKVQNDPLKPTGGTGAALDFTRSCRDVGHRLPMHDMAATWPRVSGKLSLPRRPDRPDRDGRAELC